MFKGVLYDFEGEMLTVKTIAGRVSLAPSTIYKYLNKGYTLPEAIELGKKQSSKSFGQRKKTNNRKAKTYPYKDNPAMTVEEIANLEQVSKESLYRRIKKGMTPEEAVIEIKKNIAPKFPYLGGKYSKWTLERLTGVSRFYLDKNIDDNGTYTEEEIKNIIDEYKRQDICMYQGMSLYQYCVKMRYNYNVIYYSMKAYKLTPSEAVNQYVSCGQMARFRHNYALGDVLLYHFLIKMQIDDRYVKDRIRKGRSEEDAIVDAIFLNNEPYKTRKVRNRLRAIYGEIDSIEDVTTIKDVYGLDDEDMAFMSSKAYRVEEVLNQYRLFSVISLVQASESTEEIHTILENLGISVEELSTIKDELLDGFVKMSEPVKDEKIKYIWRKEN